MKKISWKNYQILMKNHQNNLKNKRILNQRENKNKIKNLYKKAKNMSGNKISLNRAKKF